MQKYALVPESFFDKDNASGILSETVQLSENDEIRYQELPAYKAVLVYVLPDDGKEPVILSLLRSLDGIREYNKLAVSYDGQVVDIALAAGPKLLLANSFSAPDYVTGEYFIFAVLRRFQINPAVTVLYLKGEAPFKMKNDLMRYLKGIEKL